MTTERRRTWVGTLLVALVVASVLLYLPEYVASVQADRGVRDARAALPADVAAELAELTGPPTAKAPAAPQKELTPDMAWEVTGAGDATYNGTYEEDGTFGGEPAYTNGTRWLCWYEDLWVLVPDAPSPPMAVAYYCATLDGEWVVAAGAAPAPTVAEYVEPPTPPNPGDTDTKRTGWIGGPLAPVANRCQVVKPCRFTNGGLEYVAFLGSDATSVVLYCLDTGAWLALRGPTLSPTYRFISHRHAPHPSLLHAGDGETLWYVAADVEVLGWRAPLSAWPITMNVGDLSYTLGSRFLPGINRTTDLAVDDADTAWFLADDWKLYSWDLSGASATEEADWATGRDDFGAHPGARLWYAGSAGEFFRTHNPSYGFSPDYIHAVSAAAYEYTGERVNAACFSYDHNPARTLTYGVTDGPVTWRYRPGNGDGWQGAGVSPMLDNLWPLRGEQMMVAGVNNTI